MTDVSADTLPPTIPQPVHETPSHRTSSYSVQDVEKDLEKGESGSQGNADADREAVVKPKTKEEDNNLVVWDGPNDPGNPQNWPRSKKYRVTVFYASLTFCLTFASSVFSTATMVTAKLYGVSNEVMILGTSLFVLVSILHSPGVWGLCSP